MSPDVDVVGVQVQSGGVGIDLTRAAYAVLYSVGFSLGDYEQLLKRVHRPGQERATTYIHLLAEDTVDEKVYQALAEKRKVVEFVLGMAD
jgi:SNF2 family DNA or RNA helicase